MTSALLLMLSLFGSVSWAFHPGWFALMSALFGSAVAYAIAERLSIRLSDWLPLLPVAAALLLSLAANPGSYGPWLVFWVAALVAPLVLRLDLPQAAIPAGLLWFCAAPFAEAATGINLSSNVQATWGYLFCLAALGAGRLRLAALFGAIPLAVLSRGGLLGLAAGLLVFAWPQLPGWLRARWPWLAPIGLAALAGLWMLRPDTAAIRLDYQTQAIIAWWPAHIWLGVGPGQLSAAHLLSDPRYGNQVHHAHNLYLDILIEWGLIGAGLAIVAAWQWLRQPRPRWVLASLAALAVHGLVDDPIYLPGVLVYAVTMYTIPTPGNYQSN